MLPGWAQMSDPFISLNALLARALTKQAQTKVKATPSKGKAIAEVHGTWAFQDPARWTLARTIALIHSAPGDQLTLLGNFHEYLHNTGARKLVRVAEPVAVEGSEYVTGSEWLHQDQEEAASPERWTEECEAIIGVTLKELMLHCPDAQVKVHLMFGGIARVELMELTRFTCPNRDTFMYLPKGLDVLGCMTLDSKLALRSELEMDEPQKEEE